MKITDFSKTALIMMRVWDDDFNHWGYDISNDYFASEFQGRISRSDIYIVSSVDDIINKTRKWEAEKAVYRIVEIYFLDEHYINDTIIQY